MRPLLFGAVFLIPSSFAATPLNIAVVDTGFCSDKIQKKSKQHIVQIVKDMTESNKYDCQKITAKELTYAPRFHGQNVLNEFLNYLPEDISVSIQPMIIYNDKGDQTEEAWMKAIEYIKAQKFDLVLTASGFITDKKLVNDLPSIWFVPSGRMERKITIKTQLFPQNLAPLENLFVIGDYYDGKVNFYDQALMYQTQIDYYLPSGKKHFSGTSRAVAHALASALKLCYDAHAPIKALSLRQCLMNKQVTLFDPVLKKEFKTF
jgi:hypothetical protein